MADEEESEAGDAADAGAADGAFGWSELHSEVQSMPLGPSAHGECHGDAQYGEMGTNKEVWLVVADTDGARLLHGTPTQYDHLHIDEVAKLATQFREGEHKRPTRLSVPSRSVASSKERDLATAEFASELAPWVEKELRARSIANCALFAPSHLIGAMRKAIGKNMTGLLTEHVGEFAQLTNGELGKHPRIVELLPA